MVGTRSASSSPSARLIGSQQSWVGRQAVVNLDRFSGKQPAARGQAPNPYRVHAMDLDGDCLEVAWAPSRHFILGWKDSTPDGRATASRGRDKGRWVLVERRRMRGPGGDEQEIVHARGRLERPREGAVSNTGRFILTDWLFGDQLASIFYAFEPDGLELLKVRLGANAGLSAISADGRFAVVETMFNPGDSRWSNLLIAFDLDRQEKLWELPRRTNIGRLFIDTFGERVGAIMRAGGLANIRLSTGELNEHWGPLGVSDNTRIERVPSIDDGNAFADLEELEVEVRTGLTTADHATAERMLGRAEGLFDDFFGYPRWQARCLRRQGEILEYLGRPDDAGAAYLRGLELDPRLAVRRRLTVLGMAAALPPRPDVATPSPPDARPYASTACPTCGVEPSPLPKAKRTCPACGKLIWARGAPDGKRHLLRADQLDAHQALWERWYEEKEARELDLAVKRRRRNAEGARSTMT